MGVRLNLSGLNLLGLGLLAVSTAGCQSFTTVDEACHEKVPREGVLATGDEVAGFSRLNCHRRLMNLSRARPHRDVQQSARDQLNYVRANPSRELLTGRVTEWFAQSPGADAFTGATVFERMSNLGYIYPTVTNWGVLEMSAIAVDEEIVPADQMVDEFMRSQNFRQAGLQGSWVDGGFATLDVGDEWIDGTDFETTFGFRPQSVRLYYWVVFYDMPHFEQVDRPRTYPKDGQTGVPLFAPAIDPGDGDGLPTPAQIGYPITISAGTIDADAVRLNDQNLYDLSVESATLYDVSEGVIPVDTYVVHPGDSANDRFPEGSFLRSMANIYTYEPFKPNTSYELFANVSTMDGSFDVNMTFTTGTDEDVVTGTWDGQIAYPDGQNGQTGQPPAPTNTGTAPTLTTGGGGGTVGTGSGGSFMKAPGVTPRSAVLPLGKGRMFFQDTPPAALGREGRK